MTIDQFSGKFRFLSNFYPAKVKLFEPDLIFPTVEHAYQAAKSTLRNEQLLVQSALTPGAAKRLGRRLTLRSDWEAIKLSMMECLVFQKFGEHEDLRTRLLSTKNEELIEGNTWNDTFWGICRGRGENHLGKILMRTRERLRG